MDPTDSDRVLAGVGRFSSFGQTGGALSGLLLTEDGGNSWTALGGPQLVGRNFAAVYIEGSLLLAAASNGGVLRSTDGGASWAAATGVGFRVVDLVVDPSNRNRVYAATTGSGIFLSTDSGQTFVNVSQNDPTGLGAVMQSGGNNNAELSVANDGRVFVVAMINGQAGYIGYSDNQGASWTSMDLPRFPQTAPAPILSASNATPIVITLSGPHNFPINSGNVRVRITGVTGNTAANGDWTVVPVQAADNPNQFTLLGSVGNGADTGGGAWQQWAQLNPRSKPGGQGGLHLSLLVNPSDSTMVFVGGDRQDFPNFIGALDFSGNLVRGDTAVAATNAVPSPQWEHLTHSNAISAVPGGGTASGSAPHADSREMVLDASGAIIEVDDGGIFRRTSPGDNTGDWLSVSGNLAVTEFHSIAYDPISDAVIGGAQDNGNPQQGASGSSTWQVFSGGDGGDVQVDSTSTPGQSIRYTSAQNLGGFRRTTFDSAGNQLSTVFINPTAPAGVTATPRFVTPFELNVANPQRLVIAYQEAVFESFDQGQNIVSLGAVPNANGLSYGHASNAELLWAAGPGGVFVRTTGGGALAATSFIGGAQDVAADPSDAATAYAITGGRVFVTDDTGVTWVDITGDLGQLDAGALQQLTVVPSATVARVAVAAAGGVYVMAENARGFWNELGPATLPNAPVFDLDYEASTDLLVVGTMGRGAWSLPAASSIDLPPAAICRNVVRDANAQCLGFAVAADFNNVSIDPERAGLTLSVSPSAPYPLGVTPVTLNVSDPPGATEQCLAQVTVRDVTPPTLTVGPALVATLCDPDDETLTVDLPTAVDNCDVSPTISGRITASSNPDIALPLPLLDGSAVIGLGTHTIEWRATDDSGNATLATQSVTIGPGVYATRRLALGDRARLRTVGGAGAAVVSSGALGTQAGVESFLGELFSRSPVTLRDRSTVDGNVRATLSVTRGNGVIVNGTVQQFLPFLVLPPFPTLPSPVLPTTPMTPINWEPNTAGTIAPGAYTTAVFKSRTRPTFGTGVYRFRTLQLEPEAVVTVNLAAGPVVWVVDQALVANRAVFNLVGGTPLDFTVVYAGAAEAQFEVPWNGRLFAPNARIVLGANGNLTYSGQLFVREVELRPGTTFICRSEEG